ncbi:hypothetical protein D3C72_1653320 [compost metagenome]
MVGAAHAYIRRIGAAHVRGGEPGTVTGMNGKLVARGESVGRAHVVAMLVRDQHGVELVRRNAEPLEPARRLADAEPAVEQHTGHRGAVDSLDQQRVTLAATAQKSKAHHRCARSGWLPTAGAVGTV